jgi:hypothetical protein
MAPLPAPAEGDQSSLVQFLHKSPVRREVLLQDTVCLECLHDTLLLPNTHLPSLTNTYESTFSSRLFYVRRVLVVHR